MSFWDFIKNVISNNKKNAKFITKTLIKTYGEPRKPTMSVEGLRLWWPKV